MKYAFVLEMQYMRVKNSKMTFITRVAIQPDEEEDKVAWVSCSYRRGGRSSTRGYGLVNEASRQPVRLRELPSPSLGPSGRAMKSRE